jgi:hypothetical protein
MDGGRRDGSEDNGDCKIAIMRYYEWVDRRGF